MSITDRIMKWLGFRKEIPPQWGPGSWRDPQHRIQTPPLSPQGKRGDSLITFSAIDARPYARNDAELGNNVHHPYVLDFDDGRPEVASFPGIMPPQYKGEGVEVRLHFAMNVATAGDVAWHVAIAHHDGAKGVLLANVDVPTISGEVVVGAALLTEDAGMDVLKDGDSMRVTVGRDPNRDTAVGDAELIFVELREA